MSEMISQSAIIEMGWTRTMISKLLPEPTLKPNPHYSKAAPMKLWDKETVIAVMETEDFKNELEKANRRKNSAVKAVKTKETKLVEKMKSLAEGVSLRVIPEKVLLSCALSEKEKYYNSREIVYMESPDEATINRWVVNYIRHNLVDYDSMLEQLIAKTGKDEAYFVLKSIILEKIAQAYPTYADECHNQIKTLNGGQR